MSDTTTTTSWTTRDGRALPVGQLDDKHLQSILFMGLNAVKKARVAHAFAEGPNGSFGIASLADLDQLKYPLALRTADDPAVLWQDLEASPRFGPVVEEGKRRGLKMIPASMHLA